MARVQDIQISDASLKAQYISYFLEGNYSAMSNLIASNPQLDYKAFVANIMNDVATILSTLQNNYQTNVPDYLAVLTTEFDTRVGQFKDFDEWDSGAEYSLYNFVDYNGDIYMYINQTPSAGNAPGDENYWILIGLRGNQGAPGVGLNLRYAWSSVVEYNPLDLVFFGDSSWVAMYTNTNQQPSEVSTYWFRFAEHKPVEITVSTTQPENRYLGQIWMKIKE